jgi:ataxin-10
MLLVFRKLIGADQTLWADLRRLWKDLARSKSTFWDNDDDEEADGSLDTQSRYARALSQAVSKFTRNLVAGVPENQARA